MDTAIANRHFGIDIATMLAAVAEVVDCLHGFQIAQPAAANPVQMLCIALPPCPLRRGELFFEFARCGDLPIRENDVYRRAPIREMHAAEKFAFLQSFIELKIKKFNSGVANHAYFSGFFSNHAGGIFVGFCPYVIAVADQAFEFFGVSLPPVGLIVVVDDETMRLGVRKNPRRFFFDRGRNQQCAVVAVFGEVFRFELFEAV